MFENHIRLTTDNNEFKALQTPTSTLGCISLTHKLFLSKCKHAKKYLQIYSHISIQFLSPTLRP